MKQFLHTIDPHDQIEATKAQARRLRRTRLLLLYLVIVVGSLSAGYWIIWPKISNWRQWRNLHLAASYEEQGDYRRALLTLEQAVQIYPTNLDAKRRLADFYERTGQRQSITLWKEVVRLQPQETQNLLGLAGAALRFGDWKTCLTSLEELRISGKINADYHRIAAGMAMVARDDAALKENLSALVRLKPADLGVQLSLAIVQLRPADGLVADEARTTLVRLARTDGMRIRAVVELLGDVARRWPQPAPGRVVELENLSRSLTPSLGPRLDITPENDPIERLIDYAMAQPAVAPEDAVSLLNWMLLNGRSDAALEWIDGLPANIRESVMVMTVMAEAALRAQDMSRLKKLLLAGVWGDVPPGAVARALAAYDRRRLHRPAPERSNWIVAIEECRTSLSGLQVLLRLSEAWNWPEDRRQVLRAITRTFPREAWAWRQLISYALSQSDVPQLWHVYQNWSRALAGDIDVQIETAIMGLLLQQRGAPTPVETAEYLRQQPNNPAAAVAHALALWRNRRPAEALPLLDGLPRAVFGEPRFALVYGLMLTEAGRARESEQMLDRASTERLLPDEAVMVEQGRARNRLRLTVPQTQ